MIAAALFVATSLCLGAQSSMAYTELDGTNFNSFTTENDMSLVVFYAPWAEAWEKFEEEFETLDEEMEEKYPQIHLGLTDIEENKDLSMHSGKNTLAITFFWGNQKTGQNNPPITYRGPLFAKSLYEFLDVIKDTMTEVTMDDVVPIVEAFMKATFHPENSVTKLEQPKLRDQVKELAMKEEDGSKRKRLLHLHIQVMTEIMEGSHKLAANLHKVSTKLGNDGHKMPLHVYQAQKALVDTYDQYAQAALPPESRRKPKKSQKKIAGKKVSVEVGAKGTTKSAALE